MKRRGRGKISSSSSEVSELSGPTRYCRRAVAGASKGHPSVGRGRGRGKQRITEIPGGEMTTVGQISPVKHDEVTELIRRPNHGTNGQPIQLRANFKLMYVPPELQLWRYTVTVSKFSGKQGGKQVVENRDICREVFWAVVSENEEIFGSGYNLIYDDCHLLFSSNRLKSEGPTTELLLWPEPRPNFTPTRASYSVLISRTDSFTLNVDEESLNFRISMQFLDCLVTQRVRCPPMAMAKSFYAFEQCLYMKPYVGIPWNVISMGPGMEAWNGLYGAVKRCEQGVMLNADVTTKVFYKIDMWLVDFFLAVLNEFVARRAPYDINHIKENFAMDENQRNRLGDALKGLMLKLTYDDRHVKFISVGQPARIQRFKLVRNGEPERELTIEEYFFDYKRIELKFPYLPVIHCGRASRMDYFPMELLRLSDKAHRVKKRLTPFQLAKLIRGTALSPSERFKRIDWFHEGMRIATEDEFLENFGVTFPLVNENQVPESVLVPGRILLPPTIQLRASELQPRDGFWPLDSGFFQASADIVVAVVCVDHAIEFREFPRPFDTLIRTCEHLGMKFADEQHYSNNVQTYEWDTRNEDVIGHVLDFKKKCYKQATAASETIKPLMIFIVAEENDEIYGQIKVACDKEEGIACQVIRAETFLKMRGSDGRNAVARNISMKINAKLGGINYDLAKDPGWRKFTNEDDPTLYLGIDVTHPPSGDTSSPSIAAVVGSFNVDATSYEASIKILHQNQEIVAHALDAFRARIAKFDAKTGRKPQHIVLFRDGVSDSQFLDVMNQELLLLKAAAHQLDHEYEPTISYVVVQKRHHTRFKTENERMSVKGNIPPGTVVDRAITSASWFDFYLCSHLGPLGTSRPSHYTVLYDSWHLTADEWQHLAYALCHVYVRCNKSVSIPAPVYYAHLVCDRAKRILKYRRLGAAVAGAGTYALEESLTVNPDTPSMFFV